jgi:hypothetical protein
VQFLLTAALEATQIGHLGFVIAILQGNRLVHACYRPVNTGPAQTAPAALGLRWLDHFHLTAHIALYHRHLSNLSWFDSGGVLPLRYADQHQARQFDRIVRAFLLAGKSNTSKRTCS